MELSKSQMLEKLYNSIKESDTFIVPVAQLPVFTQEEYDNQGGSVDFEMFIKPSGERWFVVFTDVEEYLASGYEQIIEIYCIEMIRVVLANPEISGIYINPYGDGALISRDEIIELVGRLCEEMEG